MLTAPTGAAARYGKGAFVRVSLKKTATFWPARRYIELNPVRANVVAHPAEYRWSSYRGNAQAEPDLLLKPHALYQALDLDKAARAVAYRELFRHELEAGLVDEIRRATNGNYALGNTAFAGQVSVALGRRVTPGKSGRPSRGDELGPEELFGE